MLFQLDPGQSLLNLLGTQSSGADQVRGVIERSNHFLSSQTPPLYPFESSAHVSLDRPSKSAIELAGVCKDLGLESVIVEQPVTWLNTDTNGEMFRRMFAGLVVYLSRLGIPVELTPTDKTQTFMPRESEPNKILLSYHTTDREDEYSFDPNVWRVKESIFPPFFTFDRTGFSGWAELARNEGMFYASQALPIDECVEYFGALRAYIAENRVTKYAQPQVDHELPERYVFHAMQIATDSVMELAHIAPADLLRRLIDLSNETKKALVVKRHPRCRNKETLSLLEEIKSADNPLIHVIDGDIDQLAKNAESIVVVNSGVGMESVIRGKPVFTAGRADYRWATYEIDSNGTGLEYAFLTPRPKLDPIALAQFVTYYFRDNCMNVNDERSIEEHVCKMLLDWLNDADRCSLLLEEDEES